MASREEEGIAEPSSIKTLIDAVLDWPSRMRIAIGAAQGLCYVHHNCSSSIIHRDVKSSNTLLDSEVNARIADLGLAKTLVNLTRCLLLLVLLVLHCRQYSVTYLCLLKTSDGCARRNLIYVGYGDVTKVNEKIDVYSFGLALLELATGKEPNCVNKNLNLADRAWKYYGNGNPIADVLDEEIKDTCLLEEMCNVFKLRLMCMGTLPSSRLSMKGDCGGASLVQLTLGLWRNEERD
ncbi:hypothetical protein Nepgr_000927 [Nepenthes gracilis]|uniref:Protein kinase domain-containing protein n=1 Tax=Nepenthes gracilis TaxID=150966 RepID=A0AAD3RX83_NEPGR|nr:hypothetical protein Nepgr_000927 [Nepenthes gracilis]